MGATTAAPSQILQEEVFVVVIPEDVIASTYTIVRAIAVHPPSVAVTVYVILVAGHDIGLGIKILLRSVAGFQTKDAPPGVVLADKPIQLPAQVV